MENQTVEQKIINITSKKMLRIERWNDKYKHFRAGINWYDKDRYDFVCEKSTLSECLDAIIEHIQQSEN